MEPINHWVLTLAASSALVLSGCGGGGSSSDSTQTGVFLDSAVGNIDYETGTQSGTTNEEGEFQFQAGETVTFSMGDLTLPGTEALDTITPLEIAGTQDINDRRVVNIARLLQTLDIDGDPSNGISISDQAKNNATDINFDQPEADFENDEAVNTLILNGGQDTAPTGLVSTEEALAHLNNTLEENDVSVVSITGTWLVSPDAQDPNDLLAFTFFEDGTYVHMEVEQDNADEMSGMEWGNFSQNRETGVMTVDQEYLDNNGDTGLSDFVGNDGLTADYDADTLTLSVDDNLDGTVDGSISFDRVDSGGIVGAWLAPAEDENDLLFFTFYEDGTYTHGEVDLDGSDGEISGMEWGTYQIDAETGQATITQTFDNNGDTGLTDFANGFEDLYLSVNGDDLSAGIDSDQDGSVDETLIFTRL